VGGLGWAGGLWTNRFGVDGVRRAEDAGPFGVDGLGAPAASWIDEPEVEEAAAQ